MIFKSGIFKYGEFNGDVSNTYIWKQFSRIRKIDYCITVKLWKKLLIFHLFWKHSIEQNVRFLLLLHQLFGTLLNFLLQRARVLFQHIEHMVHQVCATPGVHGLQKGANGFHFWAEIGF